MAVAWGEFEDMAVHYLRELAKRKLHLPVLFRKIEEPVYGVGLLWEFASMIEMNGVDKYRLVSSASTDEFMGLLFARYLDFAKEEEDADEKKDLPAGEQPGDNNSPVDDRVNRSEKGRLSKHDH